MQIGILEPKDFSQKAMEDIHEIGEISLFDGKDFDNFIVNKEVLFIRLAYFIGKEFLDKAKSLKYICTPTTGLNHLDLEELNTRNIKIISLQNEYEFLKTIRATPEHTFGLVLSLLRNYKNCFLKEENFHWDRDKYKGHELYKKKIGIIGYGRVGSILAKYFKAFDSEILYYDIDLSIKSKIASKEKSVKDVITKSDIVILSASYSPEYHQFFDKKKIDLLFGKYFINTSRGELVDEKYLLNKIQDNFFAGVAIDVIQNETNRVNILQELIKYSQGQNVIITPHIAGATYESMWKTEEYIMKKLREDLCK